MSGVIDKQMLVQIMEALDTDHDGSVSKDEFRVPYMKLFPKLTKDDFEVVWNSIDTNGDGELSFEELARHYGFNVSPNAMRNHKAAEDMTDEQIMEALQMQAAIAEMQAKADEKRESLSASPMAPENRSRRVTNTMGRRKNSNGIQTIKMPTKTTLSVDETEVQFLQACELGSKKEIRSFLDKKTSVRIEDDKGEMPLHKLSRHGDVSVVREILEVSDGDGGIKVVLNWQDKQGKSPIFYAAEYGHHGVCSLLLDRGADAMVENNNGWTVLHAAVNSNLVEVVETILLHHLVKKSSLLDYQDRSGRTALHIAAFKSNENLVKLLLDHGADASVVDQNGNAPVMLAKRSNRRRSKELLEEADKSKGCDAD